MKKLSLIAVYLVAVGAYAASTTTMLTPGNSAEHGFDVVVETIPQTTKEGDKAVRTTGHTYYVSIASKKLKLKYWHAFFLLEKEKESYVLVPLKQYSFDEATRTIEYKVTFSPDHVDHAHILLRPLRGLTLDYKLKMKDWIKTSEQPPERDK